MNNINIFLIFLSFILILLSSFFSAAETAYLSVDKSKIKQKLKRRSSKIVFKHLKYFARTLSTILICNNLVNILSSSLITFLFTRLLGVSANATIFSTIIMTPIIVVFGEIIPKILAKKYSYKYLSKVCYLMQFFNTLFFILTYPISKITLNSKITNSENELKNLIKIAKEEKVLDTNEAILTSKALDLDSISVSKILIKEKDVVYINYDDTVLEVKKIFQKSGFSRLPVKKDNEYIGIILLKDLITVNKNKKIINLLKKPIFISKNISISKALENIRFYKLHMIFVTKNQDSKKIIGIITIEDILEQLIGEIYDEHDKEQNIRIISHNKWRVLGRTKISEIEDILNIFLDKNKETTIKKWIQKRINRKIKKELIYRYKKILIIKIISNKNKQETIIEIIKNK